MSDKRSKRDKAAPSGVDSERPEPLTEGRRKFIKRSVAAGPPVLLSLAGRPAWASRCTWSGQLSGNLSPTGEVCGGEGCSPGFWKTHPRRWHREFPPEMPYGEAFGFLSNDCFFPHSTLGQVIRMGDHKKNDLKHFIRTPPSCSSDEHCLNLIAALGFHSVAALQNSATAVRYAYTVADVRSLVQSAYSSGDDASIERIKDLLDRENNLYCPF